MITRIAWVGVTWRQRSRFRQTAALKVICRRQAVRAVTTSSLPSLTPAVPLQGRSEKPSVDWRDAIAMSVVMQTGTRTFSPDVSLRIFSRLTPLIEQGLTSHQTHYRSPTSTPTNTSDVVEFTKSECESEFESTGLESESTDFRFKSL